ncbi:MULTISPECIES: helix-turn-helix domain-containing protein [unclassified Sinorhizobium]|uniref:helix-turn-helix domain-containing protein n=1 Tax=unclassified Sinorhizobium TaxID=2613772 RepID=UPI0035267205
MHGLTSLSPTASHRLGARNFPADPFDFWDGAHAPISILTDGQSIYIDGERATRIYRVEYGAVRECRILSSGRRLIVAFHMAGEWFGLQNGNTYRFSAEAIGATGIQSFGRDEPQEFLQSLMPAALDSLASAQEHQLVIGRQCAVERIAAFLVEMSARRGGLANFELPMSRTDIADYLGLTVETVSRALTKLKHRRIIRLHGLRGVEVLQRDALKRLCA